MLEQVEMIPNGVKLSELVQGYYRMGNWGVDSQSLLSFINQHIEMGITTVDHAHVYGSPPCEETFGNALKLEPNLRDRIEIITKFGIVSTKKTVSGVGYYKSNKSYIIESLETSLRRLKTDYVDVFLMHRPNILMDADDVAAAFYQLHKQGKVKHFGVSNFSVSQFNLLQSRLSAPLVTNQIEVNPVNLWATEDASLEHAQQIRMRPMAWSLMAGGRLFKEDSEKNLRLRSVLQNIAEEIGASSIDQVIFAWVKHLPSKPISIIGSGNIERVKAAVTSLKLKLNDEQWYQIWTASKGHGVA